MLLNDTFTSDGNPTLTYKYELGDNEDIDFGIITLNNTDEVVGQVVTLGP